jgi:hypothetical protein
MHRGFEQVGHVYQLTFSVRSSGQPLRLGFHAARRLLAAPMGDATRMRELRSFLATRGPASVVSRMTDAEVVEQLASRIATRGLHVYAERVRREVYHAPERERVDDALPPLSMREVEEPVDDNLDVPAQVAVMQEAARDGAPFCEECEKARRALEEAVREPEAFADTDVVAQAATMRTAAEDGTPFCAECEKARRAEQGLSGE